ncbi:alpha/beta hydrolase [Myroides sp. WP-1]|uniref:alpha/beta hydrolase n=1 Tax=Myroides sp. WP-1 TaxID=2759944 RepID=UPI0015FD38A8|nr:alpha/beta hydrolase-fold protein [Myroides sp. WP-1]MBB1140743.1 alpha/beta hydrolase [Myroides sp. WP-1]
MKRRSALILSLLCTFLIMSCANTTTSKDVVPQHDTFKLQSNQLKEERVINVWTPKDYGNSMDSLPVIYMADGGVKEDFPHIANTLEELIKEQKIPAVILVGIENTQRRRDLTGFTTVAKDKEIAPVVGGSEKFRAFIKEELFQEIEKRYRTKGERTILGESAAGLFVVETFFLEPELFANYIAFDPSLWWNDHFLVRTAKASLEKNKAVKRKLWFAGSNATDIFPYTKELATILAENKDDALEWTYADEPNELHTTIFRATKNKALTWIFKK